MRVTVKGSYRKLLAVTLRVLEENLELSMLIVFEKKIKGEYILPILK